MSEQPKKLNSTIDMHHRAAARGFTEADMLREQINDLRDYIRRIRDTADPDELDRLRNELASLKQRLMDVLAEAYADTGHVEDIEREEREGAQRRIRAR